MNGPTIVTGATGFVGAHLLALLTSDGVSTVGWWNPSGRAPADNGEPTDWQAVDILDRGHVQEALRRAKPAAIFHCAGAAHLGDSWATTADTLERNVRGTHYLLDAIRVTGLDAARVLIPGSAAVYAPSSGPIRETHELAPASPYALSKLAQETLARHMVRDFGQQVFITRSFNHVGPGQDARYAVSSFARQVAQIEAGRQPPVIEVGNLDAERDLTDVRDTVRAYRAIVDAGRPGRIYNVCSGRAYSMRRVLDLLVGLAGVPVEVRPSQALLRPADTPVLVGDSSRLRDELGWSPVIPLERTLVDLLDDWRRRVQTHADRAPAVRQ